MFTLSSAGCGVAGSPEILVLARLVQGIGAALMMPNVLAIIGVTYEGPDLAKALGAYGLVMGLAAVSGQLIGGALIQADIAGLGWRSCFLINVPIGLVAVILARRVVPESRSEQRRPARPRRDGAAHPRADRGGTAPGRGAPARLAAVDLGVARDRAADPGRLRRPPAAPGRARRCSR